MTAAPATALVVRPMTATDLPAAADTSASAFGIEVGDETGPGSWRGRVAHALDTDPQGAFLAERDGRVVGVAEAIRREGLWCLALLTVAPAEQSGGAGRELFRHALAYGRPDDSGLIVSSNDPRALRLYGLAGFELRPTFESVGSIDRTRIPARLPAIREGEDDLESLAPISRAVRGAPHTLELPHALARGAAIFRLDDRGFAVAQPGHGVWMLAARDEEAAQALLWRALEHAGPAERPVVRWIGGDQQWAIDVLLKAGLQLRAYGALCVRGRPGPLSPYLPSGPFG